MDSNDPTQSQMWEDEKEEALLGHVSSDEEESEEEKDQEESEQ